MTGARAAALMLALTAHTLGACTRDRARAPVPPTRWPTISVGVRQALADELRPVSLKNCTLARYGSPNDGGYLMCANLVEAVASAYSYGIDQEDNWGCDVSKQLGVTVHQYDCFTERRPQCDGGRFMFHDQCVGPPGEVREGHPFDTLPSQIAGNGDDGKPLLVKMDIEGAEWESLLTTPDAVLDEFVQFPMELHLGGADEAMFVQVVRRLKEHFLLVNVHFNNWSCSSDSAPLPSPAFQVLWVNKRVGVLDSEAPTSASPLNAPDNPDAPECRPGIDGR